MTSKKEMLKRLLEKAKNKNVNSHFKMFGNIRNRIIFMGVFAISATAALGLEGMYATNKITKNSKVETVVNEMNILQVKNQENDALYQHYIDQAYLDNIMQNLEAMTAYSTQLKKLTGRGKVDEIV